MIHADAASYIMPIRLESSAHIIEIATYLRSLTDVEVIVVDGSSDELFAAFGSFLTNGIVHVKPDAAVSGLNGKVRGVLTGMRIASHDKIVVADDDVRYNDSSLREIVRRLDSNDVVRPQNYFSPMPWHAVLDTSRTLINRALDGDWPGTLAFRKGALPQGYCADVLFENLELVRTVRAGGGRENVARDLFVLRRPPSTRHFWRQRVRQAYDEFARPPRLLAALAVAPFVVAACLARAWSVLAAVALMAQIVAGAGWARDGGWRYFSALCIITAPLWVLERAVCSWLAVYSRLRFGGVRYSGGIIRAAISKPQERARCAP